MKYVAVIPARGGSKRFPGKNVFPLEGLPLIARSIIYSKSCSQISETYVSTDSTEIKEVSEQFGAKVLVRPPELSGDFVGTAAVLQYVGQTLIKLKEEFDYMVLLQATNPLRPKKMLAEAIDILESGNHDSLMTVSQSSLKLGKIVDHHFVPWNYEFGQRSQDLEPLYYETGLLYISSKQLILDGRIMGDNCFPMPINHIYGSVDIDTREDFLYAESVFKNYRDE